MPSYIPRAISRPQPYLIRFDWDDGSSSTILLEKFREACPCAVCKGETIMGTTYFVGIKQFVPGMNELVDLVVTGNYGVQAIWKDGHDSGIYTWQMLRDVAKEHALSDTQLQALEREVSASRTAESASKNGHNISDKHGA